jgi:DnaJ-class molecular chaperone
MYNKVVCPSCRGNGYIRTSWEAEDHIDQCKTCSSEGEISKFRLKAFVRLENIKSKREEQDWALAAAMPED